MKQKADACLTTYLSIVYILLHNLEQYISDVSFNTLEHTVRYETTTHIHIALRVHLFHVLVFG